MENYIVRIYRRDDCQPESITGLVEAVESGETQSFSTLTELATLLGGTTSVTAARTAIDKLCFASASTRVG